MSGESSQATAPAIAFTNDREVIVRFTFGQGWQIKSPDNVSGFPGGGGAVPLPPLEISIDPLDLQSLDPAAARAAISKRVADLANVAQALALAQVQFSTDLANYKAAPSG
jgi:hypothetical protein